MIGQEVNGQQCISGIQPTTNLSPAQKQKYWEFAQEPNKLSKNIFQEIPLSFCFCAKHQPLRGLGASQSMTLAIRLIHFLDEQRSVGSNTYYYRVKQKRTFWMGELKTLLVEKNTS
jgi:hypothetical protein